MLALVRALAHPKVDQTILLAMLKDTDDGICQACSTTDQASAVN